MDDKSPSNHESRDMPIPARPRRSRLFLLLGMVAITTYNIFGTWLTPLNYERRHGSRIPAQSHQQAGSAPGLVPLEAHIISKCPDTRDALRKLVLPAMQQVHDKVDFRLSYIGKPTANDGIECLHGPSECLGNIIELCARELYPDPKISLGFVMCLTKDYQHIPDRSLVEDCALEHAIDFKALNECATRDDGAHGLEILRESVQRSSNANVTVSCTIRLNNDIYCIRDGGEWHDCPRGPSVNDLVIAVEKLYHRS